MKYLRLSAIVAGILVGVTALEALQSPPESAPDWWQLVIAIAAFPIVLFELRVIADQIHKAEWKPEIEIGVFGPFPMSTILETKQFPTLVIVSQGYPFFQLAVRNLGKLTAKYVKVHLEFLSFTDESFKESASRPNEKIAFPSVKIPDESPFKWISNKDFVFEGGSGWAIYSYDAVSFPFFLETVVKGQPPVPHDYLFKATTWAEGMDQPVISDLIVRVEH